MQARAGKPRTHTMELGPFDSAVWDSRSGDREGEQIMETKDVAIGAALVGGVEIFGCGEGAKIPHPRDVTTRNGWHPLADLYGDDSKEEAEIVSFLRAGDGASALGVGGDLIGTRPVCSSGVTGLLAVGARCFYTDRGPAVSRPDGWSDMGTGGGCDAWYRDLGAREALITLDSQIPRYDDPEITIGIYEKEDGAIGGSGPIDDLIFVGKLGACLAWFAAVQSGETIELADLRYDAATDTLGIEDRYPDAVRRVPLHELLAHNAHDEETIEALMGLAPGAEVVLGGGAVPAIRYTRSAS